MLRLAIEIDKALDVGCFGASSRAIDNILEAVGIAQKLNISDVVVFVAVDKSDRISLCFVNLEAQCV